MRRRTLWIAVLSLLVLAHVGFAQMHESLNLDAIYRIKAEGLQNSQVMETMSYLTDVHGPRLTGSPNMWAAGEWAKGKLEEWGMQNVHFETWKFGRGWSNQYFVAHVVAPQAYPLIGAPLAWTPGTDGAVRAEAVFAPFDDPEKFDEYVKEYQGKLKGKFVLVSPLRDVEAAWEAPAHRYTEKELARRAQQPIREEAGGPPPNVIRRYRALRRIRNRVNEFYLQEGVAAVVSGSRWDMGVLLVSSGGDRNPDSPPVPAQFVLSIEHYGRIVRTLQKDIRVTLEVDIRSRFHDDRTDSFNLIAEIPGSDKADESVMLGGHFDSWHSGTGATDNAAGSAVMLEALRILKAAELKMRRTVRLGLWTGEEQGLLGSREYVKEHFADAADGKWDVKPEHEKFSVYFNVDNGTGKIRGVYLQGNEAAAPVLGTWMKPFENLGMTTLSIRNTGGTDHLAFDRVGLPGFQFIQDPVDYSTRTHHSNQDVYERIQESDMKQMAVIVASFVYHAANRDDRFPRKPMPEPPREGERPF